MSATSLLSSTLPSELLVKLTKLGDISEHVRDISRKIAELQDDPLPLQLESSVPDYVAVLNAHTAMLRRRHWVFVVAGDSESAKAVFLDSVLRAGDDSTSTGGDLTSLRRVLPLCSPLCPVTICHADKQHYVVCVSDAYDPVVLENAEAVEQLTKEMCRSDSEDVTKTMTWITMHLPSRLLQDMEVVVYPDKIADTSMERLLDVLFNSDVMIYVADAEHVNSTDKIFASEMRSLRHLHQAPLSLLNCCMTVLLKKNKSVEGVETVLSELEETCTISILTDVLSSSSSAKPGDSASLTPDEQQFANVHAILNSMSRTLSTSVETRIAYHYEWLISFVSRVLHHLKAFLSQAASSHEQRLETHRNILARLTALTERSQAFLKALEMEVDARYQEGITLLRDHLSSDEVVQRLSTWTLEEAPSDEGAWPDIDEQINLQINARIRRELLSWERHNRFFAIQRPRLIELFERRFHGIKTHLSNVEAMISRHDSHLGPLDASPTASLSSSTDEGSQAAATIVRGLPGTSSFPFSGSVTQLHWTRKLALGLAAPLLVPLAVAAALLGLPILGGLAARGYVAERRSEQRAREYRADRVRYLSSRTSEAVRTFAKSSTTLADFVSAELRPALRCVQQLRDEVPRQIAADREQMLSLRDDDRQTTDLERFYNPLMQVFEHSRLLLVAYGVQYVRRGRLDIDFDELIVQRDSPVICGGLTGTITAACWARRHYHAAAPSAVALKALSRNIDCNNVEDYLLEEEAYRFQACGHITRLLATSKSDAVVYHVLEPIQCSVRQHLSARSARTSVSSLRRLLLQLLRGLDYLHDRGWVHFDLSLDSVAIDLGGKVKLTNISCRQIMSVSDDCDATSLRRYTHLSPDVLATPPATYTQPADMYSVGVAMYDMWTGRRAYWDELDVSRPPVNSVDDFVAFARSVRPRLYDDDDDVGDERRRKATSTWRDLMQRCWLDEERITCKALLQLITALDLRLGDDDAADEDDASDVTRLKICDEHFRLAENN